MKKKQKSWKMLLTALIVLAMPLVLAGFISYVVLRLVAGGNMSVFMGTMCLVIVLVIVLTVIFVMTRQLLHRIHSIMGNLELLADGTLSLKESKLSQRNDEIGQVMRSVNRMVVSFAQIITGVSAATGSLVKVSQDLTNSFADMETSMRQVGREVNSIGMNTVFQSEGTQEIGTQIIDMSHAVEAVVQNTETLAQTADKLKEYRERAEGIVKELAAANERSGKAIADVRAQTDVASQSAEQIHAIADIAAVTSNQANLLALNASIEAVRAGELGKGYMAMAEEIRSFADQSQKSSGQINTIVNDLAEYANASVDVILSTTKTLEEQTEKIRRTAGMLLSLNQEALQTMDLFEEVVAECKESTQQVRAVSDNLAENIRKFSVNDLKKEEEQIL